ncbi:unnamed protein product [Bemisia tabaci]|uniref:Syntaxin-18 n=1 Tax=Bemisia tabaci TaxID=7038 RepID=A0A9P0A7G6_BEMTA|nr:PREDICTED: syntaxin-18 [Bemisia tabaci]CAH0385541.1 unnamed protein product [Bemisia tabaci]
MDITALFKACVKTVRTKNIALGLGSVDTDKNSILSRRKRDEFTIKAKDIILQISKLKDFLLEHRKAYLNFTNTLPNIAQISDFERDKIDSGAQVIILSCRNILEDFKKEIVLRNSELSSQRLEHQNAVIESIDEYLKSVIKLYSEQKAIRMKRSMDLQKMSKLISEPLSDVLNENAKESHENKNMEGTRLRRIPSLIDDSKLGSQIEEELTAEELQIFENENELLYNELNCVSDEVQQVESKVVKIAELQELLTEKVLEQSRDIERIGSTVIGTTENILDGNQQIREANRNNASLRAYVLFFLVVMSFSLLFLDWYND